jgi:fatty-acyl-CoA synthase
MNADRMTPTATATEASSSSGWLRALELTKPLKNPTSRILPLVIDDLAQELGDHPALLSACESLSFRALAQRSSRYARWAIEQGLAKGSAVGLLMPNRPEYMAIWLGITRVGGVVALLNTNLVGPSLAHCIDVAGAGHIIVGAELIEAFRTAQQYLTTGPKVWQHGGHARDLPNIDDVSADCRPTD